MLSILTDFVWMVLWGNRISGFEYVEANDPAGLSHAFTPVGTAKFVLGLSVIQFIIKAISVPFVYKLFNHLPDEDGQTPKLLVLKSSEGETFRTGNERSESFYASGSSYQQQSANL